MRQLIIKLLMVFAVLAVSLPAAAQSSSEDPQTPIAVASATNSDQEIEDRIANIFDKIDGVQSVTVSVDAGVVTLGGDVANEAAAVDAKDIAVRTAGVVMVEDEIHRTLGVKDNVTPFVQGMDANSRKLLRALPLILLSLVIFLIFGLIGGWLARRKALWNRIATNPFLGEILSQIVRFMFWALGAVIALNLIGASGFLTTLLGGAGVMGIAIGFAVRDSLENYISSIMLSLRQPFRANDHVVINNQEGIVVRLTSRATILMTLDGNHLRIPNATVFKGVILNYTTNPERRFEFELNIDAKHDPIAAISVGMAAMQSHDFVLNDPEPAAVIKTSGASNVTLEFFGWVDQSETNFGKARSQVIRTVTAALAVAQKTPLVPPKSKRVLKPEEDTLDVSRDTHLEEKINEERAQSGGNDLLDQSKPVE